MDFKSIGYAIIEWFFSHLLYELVASAIGIAIYVKFLKKFFHEKFNDKELIDKLYFRGTLGLTVFVIIASQVFQETFKRPKFEVVIDTEFVMPAGNLSNGGENKSPASIMIIQLAIFNTGEQSITRDWGLVITDTDATPLFGILCTDEDYRIYDDVKPTNHIMWDAHNDISMQTKTQLIPKNGMAVGHVTFAIPTTQANYLMSHDTEYTLCLSDATKRQYLAKFRWAAPSRK